MMSRSGIPSLDSRPETPTLQEAPAGDAGPAPGRRRKRFVGWAISVAAHVIVFTALFWPQAASPPVRPAPILVNLVELPKPEPLAPPGPPGPPEATERKPASSHNAVRPMPHRVMPAPVPVDTPAPDTFSDLLSESELAGAANAGEEGLGGGGGGGGGCNTARVVQQALRRDPLVRAAVEDAHRSGKAIMLWNGDWVRSGDQDGKGLSAVREAIMWEVAFTSEPCRNQRLHGLVLLSLADGGTRFAIGSGDWRWSDLLGVIPSAR